MIQFPSRYLLIAALLTAVAMPATAQQSVQFSKPAGTPAEKANSFMAPHKSGSADDYKAPQSIFQNDNSANSRMPPPVYYQNLDPSVKEALNKRKNWTLLTADQIMGVQTPEQVLGLPDPNNNSKLSLEEQFLLRESQARTSSATNNRTTGFLRGSAGPFDIDPDGQNSFVRKTENNSLSSRSDQKRGTVGYLNRLLYGKASDSGPDAGRYGDSKWNSVFSQPTKSAQTQEQLDATDRFRSLMVPGSSPDKSSMPAGYGMNPASTPAPDPFLQPQPAFNPAGRSVAPIKDDVSRPTGIQPLPGVATKPAQSDTKRPAWQAQLPPWLSNKPQHDAAHGF
jgi:hypothetical protein